MKPLVIIPARAGSKGIPKKNSKLLKDQPLIQYTIKAALAVFDSAEICVTTDEPEIAVIAERLGISVPFMRPAHLCTDTAGSTEVISHALDFWKENYYLPEFLVLLQPTSPFRTAKHIKGALELFSNKIEMVVSVKESKANPYFNLFEENASGYLERSKPSLVSRRQDAPIAWEYNGAIYIVKTSAFASNGLHSLKKVVKYVMDDWSSWDIDSHIDWLIAEWYLSNGDYVR